MKVLACTSLVALAALSGSAFADDPAHVAQPEIRVGDSWTFAVLDPLSGVEQGETTMTVSAVTDAEIRTSEGAIYDRQLATKRLNGSDYSPVEQVYAFPLEVGKKWSHSPAFDYRNCGKSTMTLEAEVVGWETVTVPTGTYRALRIDHTGRSANTCGTPRLIRKYWYVPELKNAVRYETLWQGVGRGGDVFVLKKVMLAK
jgi:hypothetical protein